MTESKDSALRPGPETRWPRLCIEIGLRAYPPRWSTCRWPHCSAPRLTSRHFHQRHLPITNKDPNADLRCQIIIIARRFVQNLRYMYCKHLIVQLRKTPHVPSSQSPHESTTYPEMYAEDVALHPLALTRNTREASSSPCLCYKCCLCSVMCHRS
jgi:hypothetical protein